MESTKKKSALPFNSSQNKILKYLNYSFYVFAAIGIIFFLSISGLIPTTIIDSIFQVLNALGSVIVVIIIGFFSFMILGFLIHFIQMQTVYGISNLEVDGKIILDIRDKSKTSSLVVFLVSAGFATLVNLILFKTDIIFDAVQIATFDFKDKLIFGFFYFLSHFLFIYFGFKMFKDEPYFAISEKGFLYNPAGISYGMVLWDDVSSVKESTIMYSTFAGAHQVVPRAVICVGLKNPEKYLKRYNFVLRTLIRLINKFNRYQTENPSDLIIAKNVIAHDYEAIIALMNKYAK